MKWTNDISRLLGIRYPVIQAPMFGVTTPAMVAAAAKANVLGSLALGDLPGDKCAEAIRATRQLTDKPFAVNIFVNTIPEIDGPLRKQYDETRWYIEKLAKEHQLAVALPGIDEIKLNSYHEQLDVIIAEDCKIVSFTFGNLDTASITKLKANGIILIGTCTSVEEALILEQSGIDLVCVQGIEAGGHRGSFADIAIPRIGGLALLPQVHQAIKVPVIYAGGIYNAVTLIAAQSLGAQGFQIGSLLLGSEESALQDFEKQRLRSVREQDIVLTRSFSGRYARGINNDFIRALENTNYILPYPYQNKLTQELRKAAKSNANSEFVSIWMGQSIGPFSSMSTTGIIQQLIEDVEHYPS